MGLFITEAKSVVLASLILAGSGAVGCSDSPTVSVTAPAYQSESASAVDTPTVRLNPLAIAQTENITATSTGSKLIEFPLNECLDYKEFVEVDEDSDITVAENSIQVSSMRGDALSYIRYDTGAATFGTNFTVDTSFTWDTSEAGGLGFVFALTAAPQDGYTGLYNNNDGIGLWLLVTGSGEDKSHYLELTAFDSNRITAVFPYGATAPSGTRYVRVTRNGTVLACSIFTDADHTVQEGYISVSAHASNTYRYLTAAMSWNSTGSSVINYSLGCLKISEALLGVSKSETVGVTDTPSELINPLVITKTETVRIKEGRQRSSLWPIKEEVVTVVDSPTIRLAFLKISQSDSVGIADSKTLTHDLRISRSDLVSTLDSSTPEIDPLVVTFCDNVSATDQGTQSCDLEVSRTDGVGVVGVDATRIDPLLVAGADAVEVSDALVGVTDIIGAVSDGAEVADSNIVFVEGAEFYKPVLSDEVGVNDSAEVWLDALVVVKTERISVAEAKTFINDLAVWKTENLKVTSSLQVFTNDLSVLQTDQVSVNDGTGSAEVDLDKRDLESVSISERITLQFTAAGAVKRDDVGVSDSPNVWVPPSPRGRDDVGISEARTLGFDPLRVSGTEQVGITDGLIGTRFSLLVSKTDQVSLSEVRTGLPETVDLSIHKTERVAVQSVKTVTSTAFLLLEDDVYYLCLEGGTSAATHWGGRIILWGSAEEETTELNITTFEEHPEISDSPTVRLAPEVVTPNEQVSISEVRDVRLGALLVSASESVGVADSKVVGLVTPVYPMVSDGVSVSDSASVRLGALLATGTDEIGVSEGLRIGLTPLELSQSDAVEVADAQESRIGDVVELASDTVEIADTPIVALQLVRDFSDGAEIGDSPTIALAELVVEQSDGVGIAEATDRNLDLLASRSDGVGVSEATERSLDLMVLGSDEVRITEATIRSFDLSVSGSDRVEAGEAGERTLDLMASRSDEVGISDTSADWVEPAFLYVTAAEQVGVSEARVLTPDLRVSRTDSVGVSEVRLARLDLRVSRSDGVGISEAKVFGFNLVELHRSESVGVSDRKMVYVRLVPGTGHWIPEGLLRGAYRLKLVT